MTQRRIHLHQQAAARTPAGVVGSALISGGTLGDTYEVAFAGTFSNGEIDVQRLLITIREIPGGLPWRPCRAGARSR